jgi:hypothetical protein
MTEPELLALIRERVAMQLGGTPASAQVVTTASGPSWQGHVSHEMYLTLVNTTDACLIEPSVPCTQCGFCKTHGH